MAAVIDPAAMSPSVVRPTEVDSRAQRPGRPHLVVVEGGRGDVGLVRQRRRRNRRAIALARGVVVVWAVAMLGIGAVRAVVGWGEGPSVVVPTEHVVAPGETLWGIARDLGLGGDVRVVVDELARANGGSQVRAGQVLRVPAGLRSR